MTMLVTLEQVNLALRLNLQGTSPDYEADERSADVELKIVQAQAVVLGFVQPQPDPEWDAETVPGEVSAAIILGVRSLLDDTEESLEMLSALSGATTADQRNPIAALLWRLRDPSLA